MKARDVMTREVATVGPDTPTSKVAELLLDKQISAAPVIDGSGSPIGMVSEGDLIGRDEAARQARRDWWLALLAERAAPNEDFLGNLRSPEGTARDIMSAPVVTVDEESDVGEIARLLAAYRIKRVPVVRDSRIVGIVSRADLLRALASEQRETRGPETAADRHRVFHGLSDWVEHVEERFLHDDSAATVHPPAPRAYAFWEREGRPNGCDLDHWLRAEAEIAGAGPNPPNSAASPPSSSEKPRKPGG
jgi:CBS domain-containing protein